MRHKLRCIGGTDESHTLITNKKYEEVDVIPNTYVFAKVPLLGQLV